MNKSVNQQTLKRNSGEGCNPIRFGKKITKLKQSEKKKASPIKIQTSWLFLKGNPITYCLKEKQLTETVRYKLKENWKNSIPNKGEFQNSKVKLRERKHKHSWKGK